LTGVVSSAVWWASIRSAVTFPIGVCGWELLLQLARRDPVGAQRLLLDRVDVLGAVRERIAGLSWVARAAGRGRCCFGQVSSGFEP